MLLDESRRKLARDAVCASGLSHHTLRARLLGVVRKGIGVFMTVSIHLPVLLVLLSQRP